VVTFELACKLRRALKSECCNLQIYDNGNNQCELWDIYESIWRPFGELLVEMESNGFHIDSGYLHELEEQSTTEKQKYIDQFLKWAEDVTGDPNIRYINTQSKTQLGYLFFGDDKDEVTIKYGAAARKANPDLGKTFLLPVKS